MIDKECVLCDKIKVGNKKFSKHHIDYDKNITIYVCYMCHSLIHGRLRFGNHWDKKYGKDLGFYMFAKKFIEVYENKMN